MGRQGFLAAGVLGRPRGDAGGTDRTCVAALDAIFARVRRLAHQLEDVPHADPEDGEIDEDEGQQRSGNRRGYGWRMVCNRRHWHA